VIERNRIYRRTKAGRLAWETQNAAVPVDYRRVLGLIKDDISYDSLRAGLVRYSEDEVAELLGELEKRGLVESEQVGSDHDLDFTDSFNVADLRDAQKKHNP
jgi:hypothetical protein